MKTWHGISLSDHKMSKPHKNIYKKNYIIATPCIRLYKRKTRILSKWICLFTDAVCDGSNGSDVYVPHEKIDGCKTYIRCTNNKPAGQLCGADLCFDHQENYCDWCRVVACESEMSPTTEG